MKSLLSMLRKKQKPVYSIQPLIEKGRNLIEYDKKKRVYTVPVKPLNSNLVQIVRFDNWKTMREFFDKDSRNIIDDFVNKIEKENKAFKPKKTISLPWKKYPKK